MASIAQLPVDWVDRREIENAFGVSKTVAWRILRKCGGEAGPGNTLICKKADLIARLAQLQNDGAVHEREIERRGRLERLLSEVRPDVVANLTEVARNRAALKLLSSTFHKLPSNVRLTQNSLHIDFNSPENFLDSLGALVYALHNDYEEIRAFLEKHH